MFSMIATGLYTTTFLADAVKSLCAKSVPPLKFRTEAAPPSASSFDTFKTPSFSTVSPVKARVPSPSFPKSPTPEMTPPIVEVCPVSTSNVPLPFSSTLHSLKETSCKVTLRRAQAFFFRESGSRWFYQRSRSSLPPSTRYRPI